MIPIHDTDVLIAGAGAAGMMCAIEAGKRGRRVVVIDGNDRIGRKILISGGGRCNFTNLHCRPENFLSRNPHFSKSALARYGPREFLALVEKHRVPFHEKTLGQLFCDRTSADVTSLLEAEARAAGVQVRLNERLVDAGRADRFEVITTKFVYRCEALVVATGGLSIPKIGASGIGFDLARKFGHGVIDPRPALVPLLVPGYGDLAGVATEVVASAGGASFRERMLFTHRGLSGPAILQISSYLPGELKLDLLPDAGVIEAALAAYLPKRLAQRLQSQPFDRMTAADRERLSAELHSWRVPFTGTEGYEKAEVTAGGVDTAELSSKTMESRKVPGLYFIGEVVDVTGHLGGFNFQWAWASGFAAGQYV